jgi:hypothetical protein
MIAQNQSRAVSRKAARCCGSYAASSARNDNDPLLQPAHR